MTGKQESDSASLDTLNQLRFLSLHVSLYPFFGSVASPSVLGQWSSSFLFPLPVVVMSWSWSSNPNVVTEIIFCRLDVMADVQYVRINTEQILDAPASRRVGRRNETVVDIFP